MRRAAGSWISKGRQQQLRRLRAFDSTSPAVRVAGSVRWHGGPSVAADAPTVHITFRHPDGERTSTVDARVGESLLQTAHRYELDLEGACEGGTYMVGFCRFALLRSAEAELSNNIDVLSETNPLITAFFHSVCACSTCHLILPQTVFDALPEPSEDEDDMLDMAYGLTETSRLGCQITVTKEMEGLELQMPKATRNFYVDGHVPKPH